MGELEAEFEDLEEGVVAEVEANPSVYGQVLYLVHVGHFNNQVFNHLQRDQEMFLAQAEKPRNLGHDALHLDQLEPGHLDYLCEQHDDHLQDLLICSGALLHQEVEQVVFDGQLLLRVNLKPVFHKHLLDPARRQVLGIHVAGLLQEVAKLANVVAVLGDLSKSEVGLFPQLGSMRRRGVPAVEYVAHCLELGQLLLGGGLVQRKAGELVGHQEILLSLLKVHF